MNDKLHKAFLLLLSSTRVGEIVAARDAMVRLASAEQHDIHALARALDLKADSGGGQKQESKANGWDTKPKQEESDISPCEMAEFCCDMAERGAPLSEKERGFVEDMCEWRRPTAKQLDWLRSIYKRMKVYEAMRAGRRR